MKCSKEDLLGSLSTPARRKPTRGVENERESECNDPVLEIYWPDSVANFQALIKLRGVIRLSEQITHFGGKLTADYSLQSRTSK